MALRVCLSKVTQLQSLFSWMTWIVFTARWWTSQEKSWWTSIWCYQSSQLYGIGCWKPVFSCPSQEWGLYSFAVCKRLWRYSKREPQKNNSVVGLLLHKSCVMVPSPREIVGTVWNSINVTNLSGQGFQRRDLHHDGVSKSTWIFCTAKNCAARNCHGKGWNSARQAFCTKRKSKLEKESTFLQTVWQPQTSAQYPASLMQKTKVTEYDSSSYEEICEAEDLLEEGTNDLGNQQIGTFLEHWT